MSRVRTLHDLHLRSKVRSTSASSVSAVAITRASGRRRESCAARRRAASSAIASVSGSIRIRRASIRSRASASRLRRAGDTRVSARADAGRTSSSAATLVRAFPARASRIRRGEVGDHHARVEYGQRHSARRRSRSSGSHTSARLPAVASIARRRRDRRSSTGLSTIRPPGSASTLNSVPTSAPVWATTAAGIVTWRFREGRVCPARRFTPAMRANK